MDEETVKQLKEFIKKIDLDVEDAILFGSRARGDHLKNSDVDLILISEEFEGVDWTERGKRLYLEWEGDHPLELLCYTPQEYQKKKQQIGTIKTAAEEGVKI